MGTHPNSLNSIRSNISLSKDVSSYHDDDGDDEDN